MATIYLDTAENRAKRKHITEADGDDASAVEDILETMPESVFGSIEVSFLRGQKDDLTMYMQVNKTQDGDFSGILTVAISEMTNAVSECLDFDGNRKICEVVSEGYKHKSNPSFYYTRSPLDPIEIMETNKDFSKILIEALKETIQKLELDLPRYAGWVASQREKRELNKDWPPIRPPHI